MPVSGVSGVRWAGRAAVVVLAAAVLFVCYWRQSLTQPVSSDGAANALQAWDMPFTSSRTGPFIARWYIHRT